MYRFIGIKCDFLDKMYRLHGQSEELEIKESKDDLRGCLAFITY